MYSTNELARMGRRRFLETLAKIGVSGEALRYISKDKLEALTHDPREEIPRLGVLEHTNHEEIINESSPPEREPKFYTIPRDKWIEVETAFSAARELKKSVRDTIQSDEDSDQEPLSGLNFGVVTENSQKHVIVTYSTVTDRDGTTIASPSVSFDRIKNSLPSTVQGEVTSADKTYTRELPVKTSKQTIVQEEYNGKYRPVPAGVLIEDVDGGSYGSTGPSAYDSDLDDWVHTTAGHVVDGSSGHDIHQPSFSVYAGNYIGDSDKALAVSDFDAATIDLSDNRADKIGGAEAGTYDWQIYGTLGWDTLKDNEYSSYQLRKQGYKTGRSSGELGPVNEDKTFWTSADHDNGDSGGPHFKVKYSQGANRYVAYIAGIHAWGSGSTYGAGATYIGKVEDYFNLSV